MGIDKTYKNTVVIFSHELDTTTNVIYDWVKFYGAECFIINDIPNQNINLSININNENTILNINNCRIHSVLFRKSWRTSEIPLEKLPYQIASHVKDELKAYDSSIFITVLKTCKKNIGINLSNIGNLDVNKQDVLILAKESGLKIPDTILTNNKNDIVLFKKKYDKIIIKPLSNPIFIVDKKLNTFGMYTEVLEEEFINAMPEKIFPSYIQEYIEKEFEIRSFFLNEKIYSAAIFTQINSKSKTDFRRYPENEDYRVLPYSLPINIEESIRLLMNRIGIKTGSLDIIYTPGGEYIFLEVNPVGQFGMISDPCNYYLEKIMAEELIN